MSTRTDRAAYCRPRPDDRPGCPGCSRRLAWSQPDPAQPEEMVGACLNDLCRELVVCRRRDAQWRIAERRRSLRDGRPATIPDRDSEHSPWAPASVRGP